MPDTPEMSRFGEKLRTLRKYQSMTMIELMDTLGYKSHGWLSQVETGKRLPSIEFVLQVSRLFNVSVDELIKDELEITLAGTDGDTNNLSE